MKSIISRIVHLKLENGDDLTRGVAISDDERVIAAWPINNGKTGNLANSYQVIIERGCLTK